jgi:SAM-dependent methyltransferase
MLSKARSDHAGVMFVPADATEFSLESLGLSLPFDACFSNAALHWMTPQDAVLRNVRAALREGGRFVAEMGGSGNIAALDASLRAALTDMGLGSVAVPTNYFPTVGEQAVALESAGFRVDLATWFRRPTPLDSGSSAADWTRHFRAMVWAHVPVDVHPDLARAVDAHARELRLWTPEGWFADYCRVRFVASAVQAA